MRRMPRRRRLSGEREFAGAAEFVLSGAAIPDPGMALLRAVRSAFSALLFVAVAAAAGIFAASRGWVGEPRGAAQRKNRIDADVFDNLEGYGQQARAEKLEAGNVIARANAAAAAESQKLRGELNHRDGMVERLTGELESLRSSTVTELEEVRKSLEKAGEAAPATPRLHTPSAGLSVRGGSGAAYSPCEHVCPLVQRLETGGRTTGWTQCWSPAVSWATLLATTCPTWGPPALRSVATAATPSPGALASPSHSRTTAATSRRVLSPKWLSRTPAW